MTEKSTSKATMVLLSLEGLLLETPFPQEEDFLELADELEGAPPPELDSEALALVLRILRGESPIL